MKWTRKSSEENTEKRTIAEVTGSLTGKTVRVIKSTPGSTKNRVISSASAFKAGFREEMPAEENGIKTIDI